MLSSQNQLNRRMIPSLNRPVRWQRHLRQTDGTRVRHVGRATDLKSLDHGVTHVGRDRAQAHVHVDEGRIVAGEPGGLEGDGAAANGPFGSVGGCGHSAAYIVLVQGSSIVAGFGLWLRLLTWIYPFHAIGKHIRPVLVGHA